MIGDDGRPIAAIATAPGPAGIAVIRISGEGSLALADRVIRSRRGRKAATQAAGSFFHAHFMHPATGLALDDGLVLVFRSPASFTGEDTVELHGHGGRTASGQVLEAVVAAGARLAEPGEFTRRAFVNGRMDLTQAEAVMDVVYARSSRAAMVARAQLDGRLGRLVNSAYDEILDTAADVAAWLDLDDGVIDGAMRRGLAARLDHARKALSLLLATWREGHCLREGAMIAIVGMPNAGKSSLMNALLGTRRAIVSVIPGTTRDTIEEDIVVNGISVRLVDTAGIRDSSCMIEREGVERTMTCIAQADVVIYLCDATQPLEPQISLLMTVMKQVNGSGAIVALNKIDVPATGGIGELEVSLTKHHLDINHVAISALNGAGLAGLRRAMATAIGAEDVVEPHAAVSDRHRGELLSAIADIDAACPLVDDDSRLFIAADHLRRAVESLGRITGRVYDEELLDRVFSRFCVGK